MILVEIKNLDAQKLLAHLTEKHPDVRVSSYEGRNLYTWRARRKSAEGQFLTGSVYGDSTIVISNEAAKVMIALDVLDGKNAGLSESSSLAVDPRDNSFLLIMLDSKSRSTMSHTADNDPLVQRLNADAETSRPEFSVRLQARISAAVADRRLRAARRAIDEPWSWTSPWKSLALGWSVSRLFPTTAIAGILLIAVCWYAMPKAGTPSNAGTHSKAGTLSKAGTSPETGTVVCRSSANPSAVGGRKRCIVETCRCHRRRGGNSRAGQRRVSMG